MPPGRSSQEARTEDGREEPKEGAETRAEEEETEDEEEDSTEEMEAEADISQEEMTSTDLPQEKEDLRHAARAEIHTETEAPQETGDHTVIISEIAQDPPLDKGATHTEDGEVEDEAEPAVGDSALPLPG